MRLVPTRSIRRTSSDICERGHDMNLLLRNFHVFAPEDEGVEDILVVGTHIVAKGKGLSVSLPELEVLEGEGRTVMPGLIDQHVHVTGGGGEDGMESRVPALAFSDCVKAGVTTLVGTLGTDSHTRTIRDLVATTIALDHQGVSAKCLTGAYEYPSPTLSGSIADDIAFIQPVIGCKLAISDHRCSLPTTEEIIRLASQVRLGGLIGGKVGELHIHVGSSPEGIGPLFVVHKETPLPITMFRPTHMGGHLSQAEDWLHEGGYADFTCGKNAVDAMSTLYGTLGSEEWKRVTMSSDSNGSMPKWNEKKEIIGMDRGRMTSLLDTITSLVGKGMPFPEAIAPVTRHVADALHFRDAGRIEVGARADLLILEGFSPVSLIAKGAWLMKDGVMVKKGMYE